MKKQAFKTKKSEQTFERVLESACQLFVEKGYEKTTMRDISAASELGLGALYYYFRSKEEIVQSFYERINTQVAAEFHQHKAPRTLAEGFDLLMHIKLQALQPHRYLMRVIIKEAVDPESPLCPLNTASQKPLDLSTELFGEIARLDKSSKGEDIPLLGRGLWSMHMALLGYWIHDRSENSAATWKAVESAVMLLNWSGRFARIPGFSALRTQILSLVTNLFESAGHAAPTQP